MHAAQVANEISEHEQALRRLPLPYSLALRLRDAGVSRFLIGESLLRQPDLEAATRALAA